MLEVYHPIFIAQPLRQAARAKIAFAPLPKSVILHYIKKTHIKGVYKADDKIDVTTIIEDVLENTVFEPETQDEIPFRGRQLIAAKLADGQGYVALNSVAAAFGITRQALFARLNRKNDWFSPYIARIRLRTAGGPQEMECMNAVALPPVPGWDFSRVAQGSRSPVRPGGFSV